MDKGKSRTITLNGGTYIEKQENHFHGGTNYINGAEPAELTSDEDKDETEDEETEAALREENEIFVTKTPEGREVSFSRLKRFVDTRFIPLVDNKHNWVVLWQLLKNNKLLVYGKRSPQAFAEQMDKAAWSNGIDTEIGCSYEAMRYYTGVDNYPFDEWDKILEKGSNTSKTNKTGLLEIKKLYKRLEKEFKMEAILR